MQDRLDRLQDRAAKRRQIAKDAMIELDLKKLTAPDSTASIRPTMNLRNICLGGRANEIGAALKFSVLLSHGRKVIY
jgi:hypothetical protein